MGLWTKKAHPVIGLGSALKDVFRLV